MPVNPVGVGIIGWFTYPQVETCGYSRLAPDGARRRYLADSDCPKGNTLNSRGWQPTETKHQKKVAALEGPDNLAHRSYRSSNSIPAR